MKKTIFLGILLCLTLTTYGQINIPDANFKNALLNHSPTVDTNSDGEISRQEAETVLNLTLTNSNINDLTGIKYFINVSTINLTKNNLINIDISKNVALQTLIVDRNQLTSLDVTQNSLLKNLLCAYNQLTSLDVTQNSNLENLRFRHNQLTALDVTQNSLLKGLDCRANRFTTLDVTKNINLEDLGCGVNQLTSLDVTKNTKLRSLICLNNQLTSLDISNNINLTSFNCLSNRLTTLDVSNNIDLFSLSCGNNQLTSIDVSTNKKLGYLRCRNNQLTNLDLSMNTELIVLDCEYNKIETLDARNCKLTDIDFSSNPNLTTAYLTGQKFKTTPELGIAFKKCPKLNFICVDEEYVAPVQNLFNDPEYTSCDVSNACNENYYTISGNVTYDLDNNGCDINDTGFADLKFALSSPTGFTEVYPGNSGAYNAVVYEGDYFMFPVFENPAYFNIDPAPSFPPTPISFPQDGPSVVKNFCVTPNGIHNDLEVVIIPTGRQARPGFDTGYLITYKNKGTSTQSGSITLDYQQDILTLVSANPNISNSTTDQLSWSFSNLRPMESREIRVVLNINKPTDNPAVNNGDVLSYTATATAATDETPDNNVALLNQTVVNSYDPNDKICLEGDTIEPKDVGKYLHYMIRFENKGTANAIHINVKDDIDTTKLDIKSLIPLQASHSYTTTISNKKEVEFIFNDINLPFDDANNDGYVLFKIKTKSNLIEGDVINNKAAIYFDFNPPVITDVETVTVKKKVIEIPVFSSYFTLTPNPTKGKLLLTPKNTNITVQYISIHDISGRIVGFFNGATRSFNVSYLYANTYFMKIHSDKGILFTKFIKINF